MFPRRTYQPYTLADYFEQPNTSGSSGNGSENDTTGSIPSNNVDHYSKHFQAWQPFFNWGQTGTECFPGTTVPFNEIVYLNGSFHHEYVVSFNNHTQAALGNIAVEHQQKMTEALNNPLGAYQGNVVGEEVSGAYQVVGEEDGAYQQQQQGMVQDVYGGYQDGNIGQQEDVVAYQDISGQQGYQAVGQNFNQQNGGWTEEEKVYSPLREYSPQAENFAPKMVQDELVFPDEPIQMPPMIDEFVYAPVEDYEVVGKTKTIRPIDKLLSSILEIHGQHQYTNKTFKTADLLELLGMDKNKSRRIHDVLPPLELFGMIERPSKGSYIFRPRGAIRVLDKMTRGLEDIVKFLGAFGDVVQQMNYTPESVAKSLAISTRRIYDVQKTLDHLGVMRFDTRNKTATLIENVYQ